MRNKIKQTMNKEEGFTLVELLAVIVILGIIVAIAIPAVGSVIDRADADAEEAEDALVVDAARLYVTTNADTLSFDSRTEIIDVQETLIEEGYLEERGTEGEQLKGNVTVTRTGDPGSYKYDYAYRSIGDSSTEADSN